MSKPRIDILSARAISRLSAMQLQLYGTYLKGVADALATVAPGDTVRRKAIEAAFVAVNAALAR